MMVGTTISGVSSLSSSLRVVFRCQGGVAWGQVVEEPTSGDGRARRESFKFVVARVASADMIQRHFRNTLQYMKKTGATGAGRYDEVEVMGAFLKDYYAVVGVSLA